MTPWRHLLFALGLMASIVVAWTTVSGGVGRAFVARVRASAGIAAGQIQTPARRTPPDAAFAVYPSVSDGPRITPYLRAQLDRAWRQDRTRQARFDALTTEAELLALQQGIKQSMLDAIGGLPETRTSLNARTVGTEKMEGYRIERVIFESLPGLHVTTLVYVPDAPAAAPTKRPAVLLAAGHSPLGKAFANYQRIAGRLARLGFIVICWDPIGQGERSQFWDAARGTTRYDLVCGEHAVLGNLATIAGANLARWMIWDGMRALDYMLTRDDVDPARIAITGTSGGGFHSAWIGALDKRIEVIAPSAFISSLPMRMANRIFEDPVSDPEQDPATLVSAGVDHAGLLLAAYPRPIHVAAAVQDFFPIEGTRLTVRAVRALYARFDHSDRVVLAEGYHKHGYSDENQASAFAFIGRAFNLPAFDTLPDVRTLPPERLQCTRTGQVRQELPGRGLTEVIREYYDARRFSRRLDLQALYREATRDEAADPAADTWTVVPDRGQSGPHTIAWTLAGSSTWEGVTIDRYRLRHDQHQEIPLLHFRAADSVTSRRVLLHVDLRSKATGASWDRVRTALADGMDVVSFDLPGTGETRMRYRVATEEHMASLSDLALSDHPVASVLANHAYNGLLTGRPYLIDALEAIDIARHFTRTHLRPTSLAITGAGQAATLAAAASTLWPSLVLIAAPDGEVFDWREAIERSTEIWPVQYLVAGGGYLHLAPATAAPASPGAR